MESRLSPSRVSPSPHAEGFQAAPPLLKNDGAKVTMRLFGRSDLDLLAFGNGHFTAMEDNPFFPEPVPSQDQFGTELENFASDCAEVMALKSALAAAVARKNRSRGKFIQALNQRGSYVQAESGGNKQAIVSSALGVQRQPKPVGILPPPRGLTVEVGTARGEMIITWDKVKHALMYFLEYGEEGADPEIVGLTGLRKKILLLPHLGATYHFRLCASGTSGNSPWSPTVRRIAS